MTGEQLEDFVKPLYLASPVISIYFKLILVYCQHRRTVCLFSQKSPQWLKHLQML